MASPNAAAVVPTGLPGLGPLLGLATCQRSCEYPTRRSVRHWLGGDAAEESSGISRRNRSASRDGRGNSLRPTLSAITHAQCSWPPDCKGIRDPDGFALGDGTYPFRDGEALLASVNHVDSTEAQLCECGLHRLGECRSGGSLHFDSPEFRALPHAEIDLRSEVCLPEVALAVFKIQTINVEPDRIVTAAIASHWLPLARPCAI